MRRDFFNVHFDRHKNLGVLTSHGIYNGIDLSDLGSGARFVRSVATFRLDLRLESSDLTPAVVFCTFCLLSNLTSSLFSSRVMNGSWGGCSLRYLAPASRLVQHRPTKAPITRIHPPRAIVRSLLSLLSSHGLLVTPSVSHFVCTRGSTPLASRGQVQY